MNTGSYLIIQVRKMKVSSEKKGLFLTHYTRVTKEEIRNKKKSGKN